ncbi:hypothetical protein DB346_02965 [Verrucomicrobia bacterium LW23]|nr:hypothetical protein DB346_03690 [Verrucomicrobia bacterium LW23]PTY04410.1 hypothetical protein DB346_02965 [Verrucomicrobia bacterium LW23]
MSLRISNQLSPALRQLASAFADKTPILEAMGLQLVSLTKRSFSDASLRPSPWKPHKYNYGGHNLLRKSGALWQSIRITEVNGTFVRVGSDRKYAALQQFGGIIRPVNAKFLRFRIAGRLVMAKQVEIPPRPFFPFTAGGQMTQTAQDKIEKVGLAKVNAMMKQAGF